MQTVASILFTLFVVYCVAAVFIVTYVALKKLTIKGK